MRGFQPLDLYLSVHRVAEVVIRMCRPSSWVVCNCLPCKMG